jgi:hypothetical protein
MTVNKRTKKRQWLIVKKINAWQYYKKQSLQYS